MGLKMVSETGNSVKNGENICHFRTPTCGRQNGENFGGKRGGNYDTFLG